jgi:hypothetical protein
MDLNAFYNIKERPQTEGFEIRVLRRIFGPKRDEIIKRLEKTA